MTVSPYQVVVVPFPFVDLAEQKPRPVLVLSTERFALSNRHFIGAMITTARHNPWAGDAAIQDLAAAGLNHSSIIRLKLFTLDLRVNPRPIGALSEHDRQVFRECYWKYTGTAE